MAARSQTSVANYNIVSELRVEKLTFRFDWPFCKAFSNNLSEQRKTEKKDDTSGIQTDDLKVGELFGFARIKRA